MRRTVTVTTPPAAEPVILAEAKAWAKIDSTADDALLVALITAAIDSAELYTKRSFINRTLKLTLDLPCSRDNWYPGTFDLPMNFDSGEFPESIQLPLGPVSSITSILTYGLDNTSSTFSASYYWLDSASGRVNLTSGAQWPSNLRDRNACEITYVAGYGATSSSVPMPIKTAILMHVGRMYDERNVCEMPDSCKQLLNQYRVYGDVQ